MVLQCNKFSHLNFSSAGFSDNDTDCQNLKIIIRMINRKPNTDF